MGKKYNTTFFPFRSSREILLLFSSSRLKSGRLSPGSIAAHLYRNRPVKVTFLLLLVLTTVWGQKKPVRGPRATALVVMSPDGKTAVRLIPVCIRDNDHFWDASIYQASPRPMALEPGVVYEMERTGNPIGLFIIAQPVQENGTWFALGKWQTPRALGRRCSFSSGTPDPRSR